MPAKIRTVVTFESPAFNTVEQKKYFLNPGCFGDDVANWIGDQLRSKGYDTDEKPGQEDFGWYLNFCVSQAAYCFVIGYRPGEEKKCGVWIGWLERRRGLIGSLLGGRKRGIELVACKTMHEILSGSPEIQNVRWHFDTDFKARREELGTWTPYGP